MSISKLHQLEEHKRLLGKIKGYREAKKSPYASLTEGVLDAQLGKIESAIAKVKRSHFESALQQQIVAAIRLKFAKNIGDFVLYANRQTHKLGKAAAGRAKKEGMVAGVADLTVLLPAYGYFALFVELKRPRMLGKPAGRQTPCQQAFERYCHRFGYKYILVNDFDAGVAGISQWIEQGLWEAGNANL